MILVALLAKTRSFHINDLEPVASRADPAPVALLSRTRLTELLLFVGDGSGTGATSAYRSRSHHEVYTAGTQTALLRNAVFHESTAGTTGAWLVAKACATDITVLLLGLALPATHLAHDLTGLIWSRTQEPSPSRGVTCSANASLRSRGRRLISRSARNASPLLLNVQVATRETGRCDRVYRPPFPALWRAMRRSTLVVYPV